MCWCSNLLSQSLSLLNLLASTFKDIVLNCSIIKDPSSLVTKQPSAIFQLAGIKPFAQIFLSIFHNLLRSFGQFLYTWYGTPHVPGAAGDLAFQRQCPEFPAIWVLLCLAKSPSPWCILGLLWDLIRNSSALSCLACRIFVGREVFSWSLMVS